MTKQKPDLEVVRAALAAGRVAEVEAACHARLAHDGGDWEAWALLAETALVRGRPDAASVCAGHAVRLRPGEPIARVVQGKAALANGDLSFALESARAAASCTSATPASDDALGALFGLLGRHFEAEAYLRRAVEASPGVAQYAFNLAATERMLGDMESAEARCDALLKRDPGYALAHYLRADLRTQTRTRNHLAVLGEALGRTGADTDAEILLRYALVKECEDVEDDEQAFEHAAAAGRLLRRVDTTPTGAEVDAMVRAASQQSRAWLDGAPAGHAGAQPIFVVGLPRTGTTLVERILSSHPELASVGETGAFGAALSRGGAAATPKAIGQVYVQTIERVHSSERPRFVDKTLRNYLACGAILASLPEAKIVLVRRNALDSAWAIYKTLLRGFSFSTDLADLADTLVGFRRLAEHWRACLPADRFRIVDYERVVSDLEGEARQLIDFVGLPWNGDVLRFHASRAPSATASAVQVRRPLYATSVGRWRRQAPRLERLRESLLSRLPVEAVE